MVAIYALLMYLRANSAISAAVGTWGFEDHLSGVIHADNTREDGAVNVCFYIYNGTRSVDAVDSIGVTDSREFGH